MPAAWGRHTGEAGTRADKTQEDDADDGKGDVEGDERVHAQLILEGHRKKYYEEDDDGNLLGDGGRLLGDVWEVKLFDSSFEFVREIKNACGD